MNKPEFRYAEGVFGTQDAVVTCIGETIKFDNSRENVYFDAICLNGVYKCESPIGSETERTDYLPTFDYWKKIQKNKELKEIKASYHKWTGDVIQLVLM